MEVSSHALVMGRVDGVVFDVAVFLNLGRDHLDFHADVEDYYQAKASLFTPEHARLALINVDDEHGRRLASETTLPVRTFSTQGRVADWTATAGRARRRRVGLRGHRSGRGRLHDRACRSRAASTSRTRSPPSPSCAEAGFDARGVAAGLAPGRRAGPDGARRRGPGLLGGRRLRPQARRGRGRHRRAAPAPPTGGRVIVVLGAGGDRDRGKRPIMAEIAARLADVFVVTDDNPRTEDPAAIRAAMVAGIPLDRSGGAAVRRDRRPSDRDHLRRSTSPGRRRRPGRRQGPRDRPGDRRRGPPLRRPRRRPRGARRTTRARPRRRTWARRGDRP